MDIVNNNKLFNINFNTVDIISIVRNPYTRIISDLFYLKLININTTKEETTNMIIKFINKTSYITDNHNTPQYIFLTNNNKELFNNIKILKSDIINLGYEDFNYYENINLECDSNNYLEYLNEESIKLINDFYHYDFVLFNYEKM